MYYESRIPFFLCAIFFYRARSEMYHHRVASEVIVRSDLDSHADASVLGMEVITFQYFERPVNVSGYDPKGPVAMALKTVSAGMAYDVPGSGRVLTSRIFRTTSLTQCK
jgi:hypothetical protein